MSSSKQYTGGCHCGAVTYTVTVSPPLEKGKEVYLCNCRFLLSSVLREMLIKVNLKGSICTAHGLLNFFPSKDELVFEKGEDFLKVSDHLLRLLSVGSPL